MYVANTFNYGKSNSCSDYYIYSKCSLEVFISDYNVSFSLFLLGTQWYIDSPSLVYSSQTLSFRIKWLHLCRSTNSQHVSAGAVKSFLLWTAMIHSARIYTVKWSKVARCQLNHCLIYGSSRACSQRLTNSSRFIKLTTVRQVFVCVYILSGWEIAGGKPQDSTFYD